MRTYVKKDLSQKLEHSVNVQDVNRLLELGKLLSSILTDEELRELQDAIMSDPAQQICLDQEK